MITLMALLVLLWFASSGSRFWPWMASRTLWQLFLMTVVLTLLVWAVLQVAGLGPK
jgi:hypothetical protein